MQENIKEVMKASDVRNNWSEVINDVFTHHKLIELKKSGLTVAGLSPQDLELLRAYKAKIANRKRLFLRGMRKKFEDVSEEELEREVEKAQLEVWEEREKSKSRQ
jgi:hypothetical protein